MIAPFPAASTPDTVARVIADKLEKRLGKPVVVENKPGAGGIIGTDAVAKAAPDGYTIGVSIGGALVTGPLLYKKLAYDPDREIAPVTLAVNQPSVLVATPGMQVNNVAELTAELKRKPGAYNYASIGNGSISHLAMELIAARSGTELVHVAYPGSSQAVLALLAGDATVAVLPAASVMPQVKAGKLRALAITTAKRSSLFPEIPTLAEQGPRRRRGECMGGGDRARGDAETDPAAPRERDRRDPSPAGRHRGTARADDGSRPRNLGEPACLHGGGEGALEADHREEPHRARLSL
jgi:tripartite-type tricarboxylate transporter receptor subunit TctC